MSLFPVNNVDADLHYNLKTVSLPLEGRTYEALSYAWGDVLNK
jgi:hypothetical protein